MQDRILTGDRPTGDLHIGHYVGSLKTRIEMQSENSDLYILIADIQAMGDFFAEPELVKANVYKLISYYLAIGLTEDKCVFYIQSLIPEIHELTTYLLNMVTNRDILRNPTIITEIKNKEYKDNQIPTGFFIYPVSQAADITIMNGTIVPCGDDQRPHLEECNRIVRKFNATYKTNCLSECKGTFSNVPRLPGVDGRKMGKSLNNAINLNATNDQIVKICKKLQGDTNRTSMSEPGNTDTPVFEYLDIFHPDKDFVSQMKLKFSQGGVGDGEVKKIVSDLLIELIAPIREKYELYSSDKGELDRILKNGTNVARQTATTNMRIIKEAIGLNYFS
jgi:tryptophanyl-tRNA synthetase